MTALDKALAAVDAAAIATDDAVMRAKVRGLMAGYDARWNDQPFRVLAVEEFVSSDLQNPNAKRESRSKTFLLAGLIDAMLEDELGQTVLMDHKTCSEEIEDPGAPYWRQLMVEAQPTTYMLLKWLNGVRVDYALWDVVRKPDIRPRQITKAERNDISRTGMWFARPAQPCDQETPEMYEARLAWDCTEIRPQRYFQRRQIARLDSQVLEQAAEFWEHSQALLEERRRDRHVKNSGACMLYKSPCKFLGICSGYDSPDSENWTKKQQVHVELANHLKGDGRSFITNSRVKSFMTCRQKHDFEYEQGIQRVDAEERESLLFGTLWHIAQEAWFNAKKEQNNGSTTVPVSGIGTCDAVSV